MKIKAGKVTAEKDDKVSAKDVKKYLANKHEQIPMVATSTIVTVAKITKDENGEKIIGPDTTAKSWRNIQEFETSDTMTIEVLEA